MRKLKAQLWCRWQYWITKYPMLRRWKKSYRQAVLAEHPVAFYSLGEEQASA